MVDYAAIPALVDVAGGDSGAVVFAKGEAGDEESGEGEDEDKNAHESFSDLIVSRARGLHHCRMDSLTN
jgi:hypothetical protein